MQYIQMNVSFLVYCVYFIYTVITAPQQLETNDQPPKKPEHLTPAEPKETKFELEETKSHLDTLTQANNTKNKSENEIVPYSETETRRNVQQFPVESVSIVKKICHVLSQPFVNFFMAPKVNSVLRNIGTCMVNGAMEIVTYYFPAPLIPLIATAAGMVIPFEPVVMLREKLPVTSYRRAFRTALNSFLRTFDRYRLDDEDNDPYMTRRFNRRMMNSGLEDKKEVTVD